MRIRGDAVGHNVFAWTGDHATIDHESPISRDVGSFDGIRVRGRLAEHDDSLKISVPALHLRAEKVVAPREREVARRPETGAVEPVLWIGAKRAGVPAGRESVG